MYIYLSPIIIIINKTVSVVVVVVHKHIEIIDKIS
jgi:hypothetical protein